MRKHSRFIMSKIDNKMTAICWFTESGTSLLSNDIHKSKLYNHSVIRGTIYYVLQIVLWYSYYKFAAKSVYKQTLFITYIPLDLKQPYQPSMCIYLCDDISEKQVLYVKNGASIWRSGDMRLMQSDWLIELGQHIIIVTLTQCSHVTSNIDSIRIYVI